MSVFVSRQIEIPVFEKYASDYAIGESVFLNVNGAPTEFLVIHQGVPSSMYDGSCDGTWLTTKDIYERRGWGSNNDYKNSDIHAYLNGTFLNLFDSNIRNVIKQVKIPYLNGTGTSGSVASGANGLSVKIFLLGAYEVGIIKYDYLKGTPEDGAKLDYFEYGISNGSSAAVKRICYYNGEASFWVLRSAYVGSESVFSINSGGVYNAFLPPLTYERGIRPALILPSNTLFDTKTNLFKGVG